MKKRKGFKPMTTDMMLNVASRCDRGECHTRCPYRGSEDCKEKLARSVRNRLFSYYSVVGELDTKEN